MAAIRLPRLPFRAVQGLEDLAIPGVSLLISFLAYTSQYLFYHIDPAPLSRRQSLWFNGCVLAIWWCYYKACSVDPGRKGWVEAEKAEVRNDGKQMEQKGIEQRWCKKCKAIKPPRAHHCKKCAKCIPKMDHHCPWTSNCVSHTTFPHFFRFVLYAVISMSILAYHLFTRALLIWKSRDLPAYLGPPIWALAHLLVLLLINSLTLLILSILLLRVMYGLALNTTMIESWEIERHEALVDRARKNGGWVYANGGMKVFIEKMEFPYDIGIWTNFVQGMGTANILMWVWPFAGAPGVESARNWEINGFEDEGKAWPPLDPEKMSRVSRPPISKMEVREYGSIEEEKEAFRQRQEEDFARRGGHFNDNELNDVGDEDEDEDDSGYEEGLDGEPGWTNSEGERLTDFGVDEETEVIVDEDEDIPLGELLRRRKARVYEEMDT